MNADSGQFVDEDQAKNWMQRIAIAEVVKIKGEECRVVRIDGRKIELELMSFEDRMREECGLQAPRNRHERRAAGRKNR